MSGIVDLDRVVRERFFVFIFGGARGSAGSEDRILFEVWSAVLAREIYRAHGALGGTAVMLGFDDYDFQTLVLDERAQAGKAGAERPQDGGQRGPRAARTLSFRLPPGDGADSAGRAGGAAGGDAAGEAAAELLDMQFDYCQDLDIAMGLAEVLAEELQEARASAWEARRPAVPTVAQEVETEVDAIPAVPPFPSLEAGAMGSGIDGGVGVCVAPQCGPSEPCASSPDGRCAGPDGPGAIARTRQCWSATPAANREAHDRAAAVRERRHAERRLESDVLLPKGERVRWPDAEGLPDEPREPAWGKDPPLRGPSQGEQWARLAATCSRAQIGPMHHQFLGATLQKLVQRLVCLEGLVQLAEGIAMGRESPQVLKLKAVGSAGEHRAPSALKSRSRSARRRLLEQAGQRLQALQADMDRLRAEAERRAEGPASPPRRWLPRQ
ncbi:unnamed protein product, partial [Prorocentrum cordatum]